MSGLTVLPPDEVEVEQEDEEEILVWALLELAHVWPHPASLLHTSPHNTATVKVRAGDHPLLADSSLDTATACAVYTAHRSTLPSTWGKPWNCIIKETYPHLQCYLCKSTSVKNK